MGFKEDLQKLQLEINERKPHISNEEQTKLSLIVPFIELLGYDISNPLEVKAEYTAEDAKKDRRVDFALLKDGNPVIFVEAKSVNSTLMNYDSQLEFYFNSSKNDVKLGILTNGEEYRFFTDLKKPNKMDEKPFYSFTFSNFTDSDLDFLKSIKKESYEIEKLSESAETLAYISSFNEILKDLFNSPSDRFVRALIKSSNPDVVVTAKLIEKFKPHIKNAINETILEMFTTGLIPRANPTGSVEGTTGSSEKKDSDNKIITTDDEWEGYFIVKAILHEIIDPSRIAIRDAKTYCPILLDDKNNKPICRLYFNTNQKHIGLFDNPDRSETKIPISNLNEMYGLATRFKKAVELYDSKK